MYEELVKRLRERAAWINFPHHGEECPTEDAMLMMQAADAIEELSREIDIDNAALTEIDAAIPRWIPVTERLPEFDQKVLAWVKNKDPEGRLNKDGIYTAELNDEMPKPDPEGKRNFWGIPGYDSVWKVGSWSYFTEPDVLFWMPLPQPPKEET